MLGYVIALGGPLFATLLAIGVYVIADTPMPIGWFVWPQFAMVRGIYLFTAACAIENVCYGNVWEIPANEEMANVLGMLAFDAVLYFVLFLYLDQVLPKSFGIAKHPLFCFKPLFGLCGRKRRQYAQLEEENNISFASRHLDSDVAQEQELVDSLSDEDIAQRFPLVIRHLSKQYDSSSKLAVRDLSLAVGASQVLGLLGENGAGKTTTIAMLTGLYPPTNGDAFVNGNSIVTDIDSVHASIGE